VLWANSARSSAGWAPSFRSTLRRSTWQAATMRAVSLTCVISCFSEDSCVTVASSGMMGRFRIACAQRRTMYAAAGTEPSLVITEGLLMYLPAATVDALAAEISNASGAAHWISDITTSDFSKAIRGGGTSASGFEHVRAPDTLEGEQILEVLRTHGWTTEAMRSYIRDAAFTQDRVRRIFGDRPQSAPPRFAANDPTGIHRFGRASEA
jgi:hypothetical protein